MNTSTSQKDIMNSIQPEGHETGPDLRDDDYYTQPGNLFRLMTADAQERLFANTARAMRGVPAEIQQRWIGHCAKADPAYGAGVARAIEDLERGRSESVDV